jgi:hypothetical protein
LQEEAGEPAAESSGCGPCQANRRSARRPYLRVPPSGKIQYQIAPARAQAIATAGPMTKASPMAAAPSRCDTSKTSKATSPTPRAARYPATRAASATNTVFSILEAMRSRPFGRPLPCTITSGSKADARLTPDHSEIGERRERDLACRRHPVTCGRHVPKTDTFRCIAGVGPAPLRSQGLEECPAGSLPTRRKIGVLLLQRTTSALFNLGRKYHEMECP